MALASKTGVAAKGRELSPHAPAYAIESVDSALRILRMLCEAKDLRLSEVASRLGVGQSTAHRLLSMLVHHGFARQEGRGREYRTGPMFLEMGFAAIRDMEVRHHARPVLEALRDEVGETVHLGMPYGQEVLYVEGLESRQHLRIASRVGAFLPAHCVAVGKVLLASLARPDLEALYPARQLRSLTDRSLRSFADLEAELEEIRRNGFAASRGESSEGVGSVAVAVRDHLGRGRAAISVSAPLTRLTEERAALWVAATRHAAATLQTRLWGIPPGDATPDLSSPTTRT
jgi:DNA-binding IclR family transcriptional regulator